MTARLRVAVVKPDWGIRGGFELVVDRIVARLTAADHNVRVLGFDAWKSDHRPFGQRVPDQAWARAPDYFILMAQLESARQLDTSTADLVISTQPPSYAVEHPRHLSLFFHHARIFNDLSAYAVEAGMVDPDFHASACTAVRRIDNHALHQVTHIAAGSETVAQRLVDLNGRSSGVTLFHAGPSIDGMTDGSDSEFGHHALCVSRHDFPKRTELFVLAAHLAPELQTVSVGAGSRLGTLKVLDRRLRRDGNAAQIDSRRLWCSGDRDPLLDSPSHEDNDTLVRFNGAISDAALDRQFREAFCVVAPALLEDYGLTALEAMRYGKPLIVCHDGGHLCCLVEHGVTGLVVEPTGKAIAAGMRYLASNPDEANEMGRNGRLVAASYTWERAMREFDVAIEATLS